MTFLTFAMTVSGRMRANRIYVVSSSLSSMSISHVGALEAAAHVTIEKVKCLLKSFKLKLYF
jgi:hypothetical protein